MAEDKKKAEAKSTDKKAEASAEEDDAKAKIHAKVRDMVKEKTGTSIGLAGGKDLFDSIVADIFDSAIADGNLRLPAGYGSLKVTKVAAGKKTLPNGTTVNAPERKKLRYDMGTAVRAKLQG